MASDDERNSTFNPRRRLCPDGACTGVIGPDGRCTECGTRDPGAAEGTDVSDAPATASLAEAPGPDTDDAEVAESDAQDGATTAFDPKRRLCSDESCIGVIGPDDRCSECGKPAA